MGFRYYFRYRRRFFNNQESRLAKRKRKIFPTYHTAGKIGINCMREEKEKVPNGKTKKEEKE